MIAILTFVISIIITHNEDISVITVFTVLFTVVAFLLSFPSTFFSRKMMALGDRIQKLPFRILYYLAIPVVLFGLFLIVYQIIMLYDDLKHASGWSPSTLSEGLGYAIMLVTVMAIAFIAIVLPYLQTLLVLLLRKITKEDGAA